MDKSIYNTERIKDSYPQIINSLSLIVREFYKHKESKASMMRKECNDKQVSNQFKVRK